MLNTKLLGSLLLVVAVLFAQVGNVAAASQTQDATPITGTIQSITTETDANGVTTIVVTLLDDQSATQTVRLSVETAVSLGLVTVDETTQEPVIDESQINQPVEIDPTAVLPEEEAAEPDVHLISKLLADFFFNGDPEMANLIDSYHTGENDADQVFGFGVIAQALWMSKSFSDDGTANADLTSLILQAKKSGDYSELSQYFEEGSAPTNWGQFKKALRDNKEKHNLGSVISGQAANENSDEETLNPQDHGNGKEKQDNQHKQDKPKKDKKNKKP